MIQVFSVTSVLRSFVVVVWASRSVESSLSVSQFCYDKGFLVSQVRCDPGLSVCHTAVLTLILKKHFMRV